MKRILLAMLTAKDLQAIDNLIQKRVETSENRVIKYIDYRILKTEFKLKKYFEKLFNFLVKDVMDLKRRVEKLEDNSSYT